MLKTILIDDEQDSLESLKLELESYCPQIAVIGCYQDPREGMKAILNDQPDLVFLDIEMPYLNGFELLESLPSVASDVIFVTAYDEFAIRAFEFNASDYLLKPIMKSKLIEAVNKICDKSQHRFENEKFRALLNNVKMQYHHGIETIALPISEGFEFVHINDIIYLKAESNYTWVYLVDGHKYLLAKTLKQVCTVVKFPQFFRSHHSWMVNLNHVKKYIRGQGGYLISVDGAQIPVSRANKESLMSLLNM